MKTFTEKRFYEWYEDERAVSLRAMSGSYGGGSEVLVIEPICFRDDVTIKIDRGGCAFTLDQRDYKGVQCVMQMVTGTVSPGGHPGSYNGQDAYNDMLVKDDGCELRQRTTEQYLDAAGGELTRHDARSADDFEGGGGVT